MGRLTAGVPWNSRELVGRSKAVRMKRKPTRQSWMGRLYGRGRWRGRMRPRPVILTCTSVYLFLCKGDPYSDTSAQRMLGVRITYVSQGRRPDSYALSTYLLGVTQLNENITDIRTCQISVRIKSSRILVCSACIVSANISGVLKFIRVPSSFSSPGCYSLSFYINLSLQGGGGKV
jgi:hypothetical protein